MAASKAAARYAKAILDLSIEMNNVETIHGDISMIDELCYENREFVAFLNSPIIQRRKKYQVFDAAFEGRVDPLTMKFLKQVTKNGREKILTEITESFITQYRKYKGILDVYVKSAIPLEPKVKEAITAYVKKHFEGKVELHEKIDETLIGGFVIRIEDQQIDASIANQLANLKNVLLN